jgi:hypothetical protein
MRDSSAGPEARAGRERKPRRLADLGKGKRIELRRDLALEPGLVALVRMLASPGAIAAMALADRLASQPVHGWAAARIIARGDLCCEGFAIGKATSLSLAACSRIRAGVQIPHPRHWDALLALVEAGNKPAAQNVS